MLEKLFHDDVLERHATCVQRIEVLDVRGIEEAGDEIQSSIRGYVTRFESFTKGLWVGLRRVI